MLFKQSKHVLNADSNGHQKNTKNCFKTAKKQQKTIKNMFYISNCKKEYCIVQTAGSHPDSPCIHVFGSPCTHDGMVHNRSDAVECTDNKPDDVLYRVAGDKVM